MAFNPDQPRDADGKFGSGGGGGAQDAAVAKYIAQGLTPHQAKQLAKLDALAPSLTPSAPTPEPTSTPTAATPGEQYYDREDFRALPVVDDFYREFNEPVPRDVADAVARLDAHVGRAQVLATEDEFTSIQNWSEGGYTSIRLAEKGVTHSDDGLEVGDSAYRDRDNLYAWGDKVEDEGLIFRGNVYRGLANQDPDDWLNKEEWTADALASTSVDPLIADEFSSNGMGVVMRISTRRGLPVGRMSSHPREQEVIIRKGSRFIVTGRSRTRADKLLVDLEEVFDYD